MVRFRYKPKTAEEALHLAEIRANKRELLRVLAAERASVAIASAINHSDSITAIRVQQPKSFSLYERIKMILLQLERYKVIEAVAESIATEVAESFAAEVEKDDSALIHKMFAPKRLLVSPVIALKNVLVPPVIVNELWYMKVIVFDHLSSSEKIKHASESVSRITGVDLDWQSPMLEDPRIDMMLFELARFEVNVMVAELNVLLPIQTKTSMIAVNVMVARLNEFVTTVTSNPQSNATVILRLATAALRRVVLVIVNEMPFSKETLLMELSQFEESTLVFEMYMIHCYGSHL
jgi:hypothetical protein